MPEGPLFVIEAQWKVKESDPWTHGLAICSDPNTPVTFVTPDGKPVITAELWNYNLHHHRPWSRHYLEW